jgi:NAD(P)-dependent dehydrogenase (short-subunit alcohol dehydrogenase family)
MALTKAMAQEFAPYNVLVNAMLVGLIDSDQWVRRHAAEGGKRSYDDFTAEMGQRIPMGRIGQPEEFADLACFLASDNGSYITGTAINVDGGRAPVV